ncbi:MAG: hypothetical protein ACE363_08430 [Alphaproteobacteria bacterium]
MKRRAVPSSDKSIDSAEVQLAAAVILRALTDAGVEEGDGIVRRDANLEKAQAIRFLTASSGEWAISRNFWCGLAGINADALTERLSAIFQTSPADDAEEPVEAR